MPTNDERDRAKKGIKARADAVKALIANHQEEFDKMVTANRVALGLPSRPAGPTVEQLRARLEKAEERAAKLREELSLAS